jgi:outer membrane protein OmpA-like peptidoglycan-associated protein/tetratricopeptide (TPR) repeat protein
MLIARKFYLFCLFLILAIPPSCKSQPGIYDIKNKKAIASFEEGLRQYQYRQALKAKPHLLDAVKAEKNFFEANMLLGDVLTDLKEYEDAIKYYQIALSIKPDKLPQYYNNMAGTMLLAGRYEEAIAPLERFLGYPNQKPDNIKKAQFRLACAKLGAHAVKNPVDFQPKNMGVNVNSEFDEYYPALTVDNSHLYFTRRRKADAFSQTSSAFEEDFYLSLYVNHAWEKARPLGPPLNTHYNEGVQSISPDGRTFVFTACEKDEGYGSCDLYISEKTGGKWQKPVNLGPAINSKFWETQPSLSADGSLLVFVSTRPGGSGKADLWMSRKDVSGKWGEAQNLGLVLNTEDEENSPFLHPDGKTLYFSSKGHPGLGGFDLFKSELRSDGTWGRPINLGYPINTTADERHVIINASGKTGFISANYPETFGGIDIYEFKVPEEIKPEAVTYVKGIIKSAQSGKALGAQFELVDLKSGKLIISGNSDAITGEYISCIPSAGRYAFNAKAEGHLFHSENFSLDGKDENKFFDLDIQLKPFEKGASVVLNNIFFETASAMLLPESDSELDKLFKLLEQNPSMNVEISGHTDNVGSAESNQQLSEQRALSVVDYLQRKGIATSRMTAKGYGAKMPVADNNKEEGRARNRRTEFKVIE